METRNGTGFAMEDQQDMGPGREAAREVQGQFVTGQWCFLRGMQRIPVFFMLLWVTG